MELEIRPYRCLPCSLEVFKINGIEALEEDFGEKDIYGSCFKSNCCCEFKPKPPTSEILSRYGICVEEYAEICEELIDALSVIHCGWCS